MILYWSNCHFGVVQCIVKIKCFLPKLPLTWIWTNIVVCTACIIKSVMPYYSMVPVEDQSLSKQASKKTFYYAVRLTCTVTVIMLLSISHPFPVSEARGCPAEG